MTKKQRFAVEFAKQRIQNEVKPRVAREDAEKARIEAESKLFEEVESIYGTETITANDRLEIPSWSKTKTLGVVKEFPAHAKEVNFWFRDLENQELKEVLFRNYMIEQEKAEVEANKKSGLSKLTEAEKVALGLIKPSADFTVARKFKFSHQINKDYGYANDRNMVERVNHILAKDDCEYLDKSILKTYQERYDLVNTCFEQKKYGMSDEEMVKKVERLLSRPGYAFKHADRKFLDKHQARYDYVTSK